MTPPTIGPTAVDSPTDAPYMPNALPRSALRNRSWMIPEFCGPSIPAVKPCTSRATISSNSDGAAPHSALVSTKPASEIMNIRRRPSASPRRPADTSARPNASV
jgi:hypothetical protein